MKSDRLPGDGEIPKVRLFLNFYGYRWYRNEANKWQKKSWDKNGK